MFTPRPPVSCSRSSPLPRQEEVLISKGYVCGARSRTSSLSGWALIAYLPLCLILRAAGPAERGGGFFEGMRRVRNVGVVAGRGRGNEVGDGVVVED